MSYGIPLKAKTLPEAVTEARGFLKNANDAKLRMLDNGAFLFVFKGHVAAIVAHKVHPEMQFSEVCFTLCGYSSGLREITKGSFPVMISESGSIVVL